MEKRCAKVGLGKREDLYCNCQEREIDECLEEMVKGSLTSRKLFWE